MPTHTQLKPVKTVEIEPESAVHPGVDRVLELVRGVRGVRRHVLFAKTGQKKPARTIATSMQYEHDCMKRAEKSVRALAQAWSHRVNRP